MNENELDFIANLSQLISLYLLLKDASNNDLMRELQNQNKKYFERIVKKLDEIDSRLSNLEKKAINKSN